VTVRSAVELVLAVAAAVGCVVSWIVSRSTVVVAPIADGEPTTTSISYSAPWLLLAFVLGTLAGVLFVLASVRVCSSTRRGSAGASAPSQPTRVQ